MKFTDEELSRIMDAHESSILKRRGMLCEGTCCMIMAALGASSSGRGWAWDDWYYEKNRDGVNAATTWFDGNYNPNWTADEFLAQLEAQGWA
jgi:hypothetical protein